MIGTSGKRESGKFLLQVWLDDEVSIKHFHCLRPVLWLTEICMSQTPSHQRWDTLPINCTPKDAHASVFFPYFWHSTCKTHLCSFWTLRWAILVVTCFFFSPFLPSFWCCYERNSIHTASLSHFISLVRPTHHLLSSRGQLLDWHKRQLFCPHIQHATRLFEQQTPVRRQWSVVSAFQYHYTLLKSSWVELDLPQNSTRKSSWFSG